MPKKFLVSFVVLNWNGLDDTLECLKSIRRQTISNYEVIVVDNGSEASQKEALRKIKEIKLIDLPQNTGFTGGQLTAYKIATGEFMALVNNDSVLAPDWAEKALSALRQDRKSAAVGGRAYEWNDAKGQKALVPTNNFYSYQVVDLITGHTKTLRYGDKGGSVNSISGAAVMIRRTSIERVGYFDKRFFAYYEETDLFARFKRAGMKILYDPSLATWHKIAQSSNRANPNFYLFYMHRNRFIFAAKNYDRSYFLSFLSSYTREVIRATYKLARHEKNSATEEYNLIRAGIWNLIHLPRTMFERRKIQRPGGNYSFRLLGDMGESISVVITCYNYGQYVGQAIESVLSQTLLPDEIIVINDGSTDDSLAAINKFKDKVIVIDQKNCGVIVTKNKGLRLATSDWIIFLDADDYLDKNYTKRLYDEARKQNADLVYCGMRFVGQNDGAFESRPFSSRSLRRGNYINNSALMRRQLVLDIDGYKKNMDFGYEDWELYLNLAKNKSKFSYVDDLLLFYRRHESISRDVVATGKLHHAHETVKRLHPTMFSLRYRTKDLLHDIFTFHQRRSIIKVFKDWRYLVVKNLDDASLDRPWLNKLIGMLRLVISGQFGQTGRKILLNLKRLIGRTM